MSRLTFKKYGELAGRELSDTVVSGRYGISQAAESRAVEDIAEKLHLSASDRLLEIGCGPGNMLIPLSFRVSSATGIDHPSTVERLKSRFSDTKIACVGVNFLDYEPPEGELFDKILIYSVISAVADRDEAFVFLDKAAELLSPGGRMLVGDIANSDVKTRFRRSEYGRQFHERWIHAFAKLAENSEEKVQASVLAGDEEMFTPDDAFIVAALLRYRGRGMECYVFPQPADLPFGNTREDLLIVRHR